MAIIEAYLDRVCGRLRVNPAEAEDIREELRSHLEEATRERQAGGMSARDAGELALAAFGDADRICLHLDRVHHGDAWWALRLKGLILGMLVGGMIAVLVPIGGHLGPLGHFLAFLGSAGSARLSALVNGLASGGVIGALAAGGRGVLTGWSAGAVLWLAESVVCWIIGAGAGEPASGMLQTVLLAPLLGGVFGAAVGAAASTALSAASRVRPHIE